MKIETSQVTKILITDIPNLDAITVILEDLGPRQGKVNIDCYGQAWSAYWGGIGNKNVSDFFLGCDEHYLAKNLSSIPSHVTDYDAIKGIATTKIQELITELITERRELWTDKNITRKEYNELKNNIENIPNIDSEIELSHNETFLSETFGDEWWRYLPEKPNHEYTYLCRIINAVKEGLKTLKP